MSATDITFNVIVSGSSVSGNLAVHKTKLMIDLGNSDKIGKVEFALQNKDNTYSSELVSGNATVQIDAMQGNNIIKTVFRGTLEEVNNEVDVKQGTQAHFIGYDYAQELLGLISPDSRQKSLLTSTGTISLVSGEQGMGSTLGMDLALYVSGVVGSGAAGYGLGATSGTPATTLSAFMSQYFGKSGDTTGTNSGLAFSFKPYLSGMTTSGVFPGSTYKTWYAQDGATDSNANYVITFDTLRAKHEYAWDVIRKLTRQSLVLDRSGFKVQFEVYIGVSGDINMITSGTSNFLSNATLIYYQAGQSGSKLNNLIDAKVPWSTTALKDEIIGWFPVWTQYPFTDDWADLLAYSGSYWTASGSASGYSQPIAGTVTLSGGLPAPGTPSLISIYGKNTSGAAGTNAGFTLLFNMFSGYSVSLNKWNVSGGNGVALSFFAQPSTSSLTAADFGYTAILYDLSGNYIISSGLNGTAVKFPLNLAYRSGWTQVSMPIFTGSGTFLSGDGTVGTWAFGSSVPATSGIPDLAHINRIGIGSSINANAAPPTHSFAVDYLTFQFQFDYNPVIALNSGSISAYGRRYEVFEFPYQVTDSGAGAVVTTELQSKSQSRQLAIFTIKDNPLTNPAQLNITPGQAFIVDAPSLNTGSGQTFYYWRATDVRHEWDTRTGFITYIKAYPWTSGGSAQSGQNLISYSLPLPAPKPNVVQSMPLTTYWHVSKG